MDGLVVNTCGGNDEAIAAAAGRLPVVLLDRDVADGGIDLVTSNNRELVAGLVDALAAAGSERLCLLTEASDDSPVRRERAEAFADELSRRGLSDMNFPKDIDSASKWAQNVSSFSKDVSADPVLATWQRAFVNVCSNHEKRCK